MGFWGQWVCSKPCHSVVHNFDVLIMSGRCSLGWAKIEILFCHFHLINSCNSCFFFFFFFRCYTLALLDTAQHFSSKFRNYICISVPHPSKTILVAIFGMNTRQGGWKSCVYWRFLWCCFHCICIQNTDTWNFFLSSHFCALCVLLTACFKFLLCHFILNSHFYSVT